MQELKDKKLLFYSGTYVKDRRNEKNYDYLTYDENLKRDYNIYYDLDTYQVYHVDIPQCELFEQENIVIHIPVITNSSHEYMRNYINLLTWYNEEKNKKTAEEIKEELQIKFRNKNKVKNMYKINY